MRARELAVCFALGWCAVASGADRGDSPQADSVARGKLLFFREWSPNDPLCREGDGLGPVYNAKSCAACHNLGRPGGAGTREHNVTILTAIANTSDAAVIREARAMLANVYPSFRTQSSIVLHRYGLDPLYAQWRATIVAQRQGITMRTTERNTPHLFGAARIDSIPDEVIEARARRYPLNAVAGRVSRLADGRIGRFGWKGQAARLGDFVRGACAIELGLTTPGHPQMPSPFAPEAGVPKLDLTDDDCNALTAYVATLPEPGRRVSSAKTHQDSVDLGQMLFHSIGCADCHVEKLGDVDGIYSDLLLHDMGLALSDAGAYYGEPLPSADEPNPPELASDKKRRPADRTEWRTPPLWGLRDSGPYLHDGQAKTLVQAIGLHGGDAQRVTRKYQSLSASDEAALRNFLVSLVGPSEQPARPAARTERRGGRDQGGRSAGSGRAEVVGRLLSSTARP